MEQGPQKTKVLRLLDQLPFRPPSLSLHPGTARIVHALSFRAFCLFQPSRPRFTLFSHLVASTRTRQRVWVLARKTRLHSALQRLRHLALTRRRRSTIDRRPDREPSCDLAHEPPLVYFRRACPHRRCMSFINGSLSQYTTITPILTLPHAFPRQEPPIFLPTRSTRRVAH